MTRITLHKWYGVWQVQVVRSRLLINSGKRQSPFNANENISMN